MAPNLANLCYFISLLSLLHVPWTEVISHCPNMQPQGSMQTDLVAQVLLLIQVSIHPRHRLYPASLCEDVQQEVPSYYPPLQL